MASAVQNPPAESKSAKKKKARQESSANGSVNAPAVPDLTNHKADSSQADGESRTFEHPYLKELNKQIRNTHKKLAGTQKVDAIIADNPGVSLDDLVAQRKINADQKAAALKKPQLQQQLAKLEEQVNHYRQFDADYQSQMKKQKEELTVQHQKELEKLREELQEEGKTIGATELRSKLMVLCRFLNVAAAKRGNDGEADTDEGRAFEGALLGVYGGNEEAVETALKLIDGIDEIVPDIEGSPTATTYSRVKEASMENAQFQAEEKWVDSVAEANANSPDTDPTVAHAGLTELDNTAQTNGVHPTGQEPTTIPSQADAGDDAGNAAGDRWDTTAAGGAAKGDDESFEMVPRPQDEVDTPVPSALPADALLQERSGNSWADEPPSYGAAPTGFTADTGDVKAAIASSEPQVDANSAPAEAAQPLSASGWADCSDAAAGAGPDEGDGFHQVAGRHRGRGGLRGRGDGEFRGRGRGRGGFRGDGEFRGRGRGGFRGRGDGEFRGGRGDGEFRGRGGRGRGRGGSGAGAESGPNRAS